LVAVSTDEIAGAEGLVVGVDVGAVGGLRDALDGVFPVEADSEAGGAVEQEPVEDSAADTASGACGEGGFGGGGMGGGRLVVEEADAAEWSGFDVAEVLIEIEAEGGEGSQRVGHEAFAAGFVDAGLHGVDDLDLKTLVGGGDGAGQTSWPCAYDENVSRI